MLSSNQGPDVDLDVEDTGATQAEAMFSLLERSTKRDLTDIKEINIPLRIVVLLFWF